MFEMFSEETSSINRKNRLIVSNCLSSSGDDTIDFLLNETLVSKADLEAVGRVAYAKGLNSDLLCVAITPQLKVSCVVEVSHDPADAELGYIVSIYPNVYLVADTIVDVESDFSEAVQLADEWGRTLARLYQRGYTR